MPLGELASIGSDEAIRSEAWERLTEVLDPELGIDLVNLGLIYELAVEDGTVEVAMTLTTPGCPMSGSMPQAVERALETIPGVKAVGVELVWDPPWEPEAMTRAARDALGWR